MANLITSNSLNYQSEIQSAFTAYLRESGASSKTITNYLSDLRSFMTWYTNSYEYGQNSSSEDLNVLPAITEATIQAYKSNLLTNRTPSATINRKLSSLRTFFLFASTKGLTSHNPSENIKNIKHETKADSAVLLEDFTEYLSKNGASDKTKSNYRVDINHFLSWVRKTIILPHHTGLSGNSTDEDILIHADEELITSYIQDQNRTHTPIATINRRLSSLRMMYQFLISRKKLLSSPIEAIKNLSPGLIQNLTPLIKDFCENDEDTLLTAAEKQEIIENFIHWRTSPA